MNEEDKTIKALFEAERFSNNLLKKENQKLQKLHFQLNKEVLIQLKEMVMLDVSRTIHEMQFKLDAVLCFYANKVDPESFPLKDGEEKEVKELMLEGYKAFLTGLKEDAKKGEEFKKGGLNAKSESNQVV